LWKKSRVPTSGSAPMTPTRWLPSRRAAPFHPPPRPVPHRDIYHIIVLLGVVRSVVTARWWCGGTVREETPPVCTARDGNGRPQASKQAHPSVETKAAPLRRPCTPGPPLHHHHQAPGSPTTPYYTILYYNTALVKRCNAWSAWRNTKRWIIRLPPCYLLFSL